MPLDMHPDFEHGYFDSNRVGITTCSIAMAGSKPAAAAAIAKRLAFSGSSYVVFAKCRLNFIQALSEQLFGFDAEATALNRDAQTGN